MTYDLSALPPGPYDLEWVESMFDQAALCRHRASCGRHIRSSVMYAGLALLFAVGDPSMAGAFVLIALGFNHARLALRDQRRADAVFARGVAAALLDGVKLTEMAEAA